MVHPVFLSYNTLRSSFNGNGPKLRHHIDAITTPCYKISDDPLFVDMLMVTLPGTKILKLSYFTCRCNWL